MKNFEVSMCRTSYAFCTFPVTAVDEENAAEIALERAGDFEYSEKDADYKVSHVSEVVEEKEPRINQIRSIRWNWYTDDLDGELTVEQNEILDSYALEHISIEREEGNTSGQLIASIEGDDVVLNFKGYWEL